jgi:hypothetical protein
MAWRFRQRIRIAKGVHLNLAKRGVSSLSVGRPGATVNVGSEGAKLTVGAPGTGLSSTHKITGRQPNSPANTEPQRIDAAREIDQQKEGPSPLTGLLVFFVALGALGGLSNALLALLSLSAEAAATAGAWLFFWNIAAAAAIAAAVLHYAKKGRAL